MVQPAVQQKLAPIPQPAPKAVTPPIWETQPEPVAQIEEEIAAPVALEQPMPMSEAVSQEPEFFSEPARDEDGEMELDEPELETTPTAEAAGAHTGARAGPAAGYLPRAEVSASRCAQGPGGENRARQAGGLAV